MIKELIKKLKKKAKPFYRSGWDLNSNNGTPTELSAYLTESNDVKKITNEDLRIEKKPVEVFKEIFSEEPKLDLVSLDKKIEMVEKRIDVLQNLIGHGISDNLEAPRATY